MTVVYMRECENPRREAERLLAQALSALGYGARPLRHAEKGRPYLDGGPWISLSHTRGAAAAAICDSGPVGVDLERIRPLRSGTDRRVMSPAEYARYAAEGARPEDFFALWTLKESYYKYLGTGLPGFPTGTEFIRTEDGWRLEGAPQRFFAWKKDLLAAAVCTGDREVQIRTG